MSYLKKVKRLSEEDGSEGGAKRAGKRAGKGGVRVFGVPRTAEN